MSQTVSQTRSISGSGHHRSRSSGSGGILIWARSVGSTHDWHAAVEPVSLYWPAGHAHGQNRVLSEEAEPQVPSSP